MTAPPNQRQRPAELTPETLVRGTRHLCRRDPDLARIVRAIGPAPMWARRPGFPTLIHIILEQQVSLASGKAAFDRLRAAVSPLTPEGFLELDARTLKRIGFSRQKTGYGRELASAFVQGRITPRRWRWMEDEAVRDELLSLKGIGPWTADIYLLMVLRRPDVWPTGDRALAVSARRVKRLRKIPTPERLERLGERWRPWRAVAARLLWHHYLNGGDDGSY